MREELPSEELLARVAQHDVAALSELYDRHAPRVYGLMVHILSSRDTAEEVLQQVFLRLWSESLSLSQGGRSVVAWLVLTAQAAAVDRLRALRKSAPNAGPQEQSPNGEEGAGAGPRKSKTAVVPQSVARPLNGKTDAVSPRLVDKARTAAMRPVPITCLPLPEEITLIDDRLVLLHKAINQLPKPQWRALELAIFGGLSESEIAAEMGEPLGKVRSSLRAAVTFVKHRRRAVCGTWAANI